MMGKKSAKFKPELGNGEMGKKQSVFKAISK